MHSSRRLTILHTCDYMSSRIFRDCQVYMFALLLPSLFTRLPLASIYPVMWRVWINQASGYTYMTVLVPVNRIQFGAHQPGTTLYLNQTPTDDVFHWRGTRNHRTKQKTRKKRSPVPEVTFARPPGKKIQPMSAAPHANAGTSYREWEYEVLVMYGPRRLFQRLHVRGRTWDSACPSMQLVPPCLSLASSNLRRRGFQTACKDYKEDESHKRIQRADDY